jgi:hypothetical protein
VNGEWTQVEGEGEKGWQYPAIDLEFLVEGLSLCRDGLKRSCRG